MTTPANAVWTHCQICMSGTQISPRDCPNKTCPLNEYMAGKNVRLKLDMIKAFCLHCNGGDSALYKSCEGKLLNGVNGGVCPLHKFKDGSNPDFEGFFKKGNKFGGKIAENLQKKSTSSG